MRDYHRENLEGEQRWREGKRERREGEGQFLLLLERAGLKGEEGEKQIPGHIFASLC